MPEKKQKKNKTELLNRRTVLFYTIFFFSLVIFLTSGGLYYRYLAKGLPSLRALETFEPYQTTRIISSDGTVIKELTKEKRNLVPYHRIPEDMINALVSTEDHRFFKHWGIDTRRLFSVILINMQALRYKQGFSTITMQLSGQLFLDRRQRTIARKFREMMLAIQIEKKYSKQEILEMHLNNEHFGHGAYGIHEAARKFFDKDVEDLRIDECALLAGVLNGPGRYSPAFYPERALNRRNLVLNNMLKHRFITQSQYIDAKGKPLDVKIVLNENLITTDDIAPYYTEYIRQELESMQSQYGFDLYRDGLTVYTSLNTTAQSIAEKVVKDQLVLQQRVANSRYRSKSNRIKFLESFRSIPLD
ncbi:MAG: hypothetical protein GY863_14265, partial [bacterium]|nr:hypothetical protein [bacterium]